MARTKLWPIWLVLCCTLLMVLAQLFLKRGLDATNIWFIGLGVALLGLGGLLLTLALRAGDLSVIHPLLSLSFVWVLLGSIWLGETIGWHQYTGVGLIVVGVSVLGYTGART